MTLVNDDRQCHLIDIVCHRQNLEAVTILKLDECYLILLIIHKMFLRLLSKE